MEICRTRLVDQELLLEYVVEAEHQDGADYWEQFETLSDAMEDFRLYEENSE